jgi:trigger factor
VEQEARALAQQAAQGAATPDDAYKAFLDPAGKRVLLALLVAEVARRNDLRLDPRRVNELMRLIASTYEEPQQVIDLYRNDPQLMSGLQNRAMEEQVIDWIAERATHTDKALTFQEAIG